MQIECNQVCTLHNINNNKYEENGKKNKNYYDFNFFLIFTFLI